MQKKIGLITHYLDLLSKTHQMGFSIFEGKKSIYSSSFYLGKIQQILPKFQASFAESKPDFLITEDFFIFGYLCTENLEIVIGPGLVGYYDPQERDALQVKMKTAFKQLEQKPSNRIETIENISLENFLNIICSVHCFLNQKIVHPQSLLTNPVEEESLLNQIQKKLTDFEQENQFNLEHTNTVNYEEKISYCIRHGDLDSLTSILESFSYTLKQLGPDALRHSKNANVILNSLALRAAIAGGVDSDICYRLGGLYINEIEASPSIHALSTLSVAMVKDYCRRVQQTRPREAQLNIIEDDEINRCISYVTDHFREKLTVPMIADYIGYSSEYLSTKFKKVTGKNLPHYINEKRISEAQRQLALTELSIAQISEQLSFSSQSYFQKTFKQIVGTTPLQYRKQQQITRKNEVYR